MKVRAESEAESILESQPGDFSDVERLFRQHNEALLKFIAARIGSPHEAREIAQEAYVQLLSLRHPEAISFLRAFLFKTAANLVVDRLRQRGRREHVQTMGDLDFAEFELSPERHVASEQMLIVLHTALGELPAKCRHAFLLHRMHGMETGAIATQMGIGERMVRRYISRALEHARLRVDEASSHTYM